MISDFKVGNAYQWSGTIYIVTKIDITCDQIHYKVIYSSKLNALAVSASKKSWFEIGSLIAVCSKKLDKNYNIETLKVLYGSNN